MNICAHLFFNFLIGNGRTHGAWNNYNRTCLPAGNLNKPLNVVKVTMKCILVLFIKYIEGGFFKILR